MEMSNFLEQQGLYDENIYGITSYLISLFYRTNCKYECSRREINRLLTIYKLCCNRNGNVCFEDKFYIGYPHAVVTELTFIPGDIYFRNNDFEFDINNLPKEKKLKQEDNGMLEDLPYPYSWYLRKHKINDESKKLLENVFEAFAGVDFDKVAFMIDELMHYIPVKKQFNNEDCIDIEIINNFFESKNNSKMFKDNLVFNFIKNTKLKNNVNFNDEEKISLNKVLKYITEKFESLSLENQKKLLIYLNELSEETKNDPNEKKLYK